MRIKVNEDSFIDESFGYGDTARDVISGGTIKEVGTMSMSIKRAEELLNTENPVMRFEGENDETRDHDMTEKELQALDKIYRVSVHRNTIDTIIKDWTDANG